MIYSHFIDLVNHRISEIDTNMDIYNKKINDLTRERMELIPISNHTVPLTLELIRELYMRYI